MKIEKKKIYMKKDNFTFNDVVVLNPYANCSDFEKEEFEELKELIENPYCYMNLDDDELDEIYDRKFELINCLKEKILVKEDMYIVDGEKYTKVDSYFELKRKLESGYANYEIIPKEYLEESSFNKKFNVMRKKLHRFNELNKYEQYQFTEELYHRRKSIYLLEKIYDEKDIEER